MPNDAEIISLATGSLDSETNVPTIKAANELTGPDDVENFGDVDSYQALGVTALPWPADDNGGAEGVLLRDVGNTDGVIIGARDERGASIYGNLKPGDTALHSTNPDASSQVICVAEDRQVINLTKDTGGENIGVVIDGKNDAIQITGFGLHFEISRAQGIVMSDGPATLQIKDGTIILAGKVVLGGVIPTSQVLFAAAPGVPVIGGVSGTGTPAPGVFIGL